MRVFSDSRRISWHEGNTSPYSNQFIPYFDSNKGARSRTCIPRASTPFEDGNGRIGRAIAEKALSQGIGRPVLLSLSEAIDSKKKAYYKVLKQAQRSSDITEWARYFIGVIVQAQTHAETVIDFTLRKVQFFDRRREQLNEWQKQGLVAPWMKGRKY